MNDFKAFGLSKKSDELRKLILENPDLPIVVLAGEGVSDGDHAWTFCGSISFGIEDILDCDYTASDVQCCLSKLQDMLDVETEPVRHSYWESYDTSAYIGTDDEGDPRWAARRFYVCHERGCRYKSVVRSKFCPNCGARMDLRGAENA